MCHLAHLGPLDAVISFHNLQSLVPWVEPELSAFPVPGLVILAGRFI